MKIIIVEPFYSGSHKKFADQLKKHSSHDITLLTLEGKFWKWRMYGGSHTLAEEFIKTGIKADLIIATDMLDLPTFIGLIRHNLNNAKIGLYFHENQIAYPWQAESEDIKEKRDLHYGMLNYHSASVADYVWFNSKHNMNSFYDGLKGILSKMPDYRHDHTLKSLRGKSLVLPLGLELKNLKKIRRKSNSDVPLILWSHRWEHDKNPEEFFEVLFKLNEKGIDFRLAVAGQSYKDYPKIFEEAYSVLKNKIIHYGYPTYEEYLELLNETDILPVTSMHDFFGISVMEAIYCGAIPLLPNRLSYPELYKPEHNPEIFYENTDDLYIKLEYICKNHKLIRSSKNYGELCSMYDWKHMITVYDRLFDNLLKD